MPNARSRWQGRARARLYHSAALQSEQLSESPSLFLFVKQLPPSCQNASEFAQVHGVEVGSVEIAAGAWVLTHGKRKEPFFWASMHSQLRCQALTPARVPLRAWLWIVIGDLVKTHYRP